MSNRVNSDDQQARRDESMTDLVRQLVDETKTLVRQELELARSEATRVGEGVATLAQQELQLAKAELGEKGRKAGAGASLMGAAAALGLLAGGAFTAFLILALDGLMPNWLAALLVAAAYGVVAGIVFFTGKARVREAGPLVPEQTIDSVKEDVQWAKTQIGSESK
jgi:hypothetical protein